MLDVAESIVQCALHRTESRGAHQRTDFAARDDARFLAHSMVYRNPDGSFRVEYLPVKITRWPPGERVYGQRPAGPAEERPDLAPAKRAS
jgi:fumarate reductase flavoprotein subunit